VIGNKMPSPFPVFFLVMHPEDTAMKDEDVKADAIPAANIGDTDLSPSPTQPAAAKEIARLEIFMNRGEETKEEFLAPLQLLFDVGSVAASEYLLRRNLDCYKGYALYVGCSARQTREFHAPIERSSANSTWSWSRGGQDFLVSRFPLGWCDATFGTHSHCFPAVRNQDRLC